MKPDCYNKEVRTPDGRSERKDCPLHGYCREDSARTAADVARRRCAPDSVALCRPLRPTDGCCNRRGRPRAAPSRAWWLKGRVTATTDSGKGPAAASFRRGRYHQRLHGSPSGRLHRGAKNVALALVAFELAGSTPVPPQAFSPAVSPSHLSTSAVPGTARLIHGPSASLHSRARTASRGAAPSLSLNRSPTSAWKRPAGGKVRVTSGKKAGAGPPGGKARPLHHHMGFANFVTAAVDSADPHIRGLHDHPGGGRSRHLRPRHSHPETCPPALFHNDPVLSLRVPASRSSAATRGKTASSCRVTAMVRSSRRSSAAPRHCGHHDLGQASLGGRADPALPAEAFPGGESVAPGTPRYESVFSSAKTCSTG